MKHEHRHTAACLASPDMPACPLPADAKPGSPTAADIDDSLDGPPDTITLYDEPEAATLLVACGVGLATGVGVVLFNNVIHVIRHLAWSTTPLEATYWGQWARWEAVRAAGSGPGKQLLPCYPWKPAWQLRCWCSSCAA